MKILGYAISLVLLTTIFNFASAQEIGSVKVNDNIHIITGKGGNIGLLIGEDGTFLIDDKFAPMNDAIMAEIKKLGGSTPRFVINTHYHGDHTGGNDKLGKMGSTIISHTNARERMTKDIFIKAFNKTVPAKSREGLPVITFTRDISFHLNGKAVNVIHVPSAHTDGDSFIHFRDDNVIHTGDAMFNGFYPFIDVPHGGTVKGMIAAVDQILELADDNTKIIPGHGPLAGKKDLIGFRAMLATVQQRLGKLKAAGKTATQAIAEKPLADLDKEWSDGLFKTDRWIEIIYDGI